MPRGRNRQSQAAGENAKPRQPSRRWRALGFYFQGALTDDEMEGEHYLNLVHQSYASIRLSLMRAGLVFATGLLRMTKTGNYAGVYGITEAGKTAYKFSTEKYVNDLCNEADKKWKEAHPYCESCGQRIP